MAKAKIESARLVDLDDEESIGSAGMAGKVVSVQKRQAASSRRSYDEAPHCPHCGGRLHMNLPVATVNFECLWRQYNVETGGMSNPDERLPAFTASDMDPFNEWIKARSRSRKKPLTYGKMDSAGGAAATYAMAKAASTSEEDKAAAKEAAKAAKAIKTGAKTGTLKAEKPVGKSASATKSSPAASEKTGATKSSSTKSTPKPARTAAKPDTNGKGVKDFNLSEMSLDLDDEPEVVTEKPASKRAVARSAKVVETSVKTPVKTPKKVANAAKRQSALAAVK